MNKIERLESIKNSCINYMTELWQKARDYETVIKEIQKVYDNGNKQVGQLICSDEDNPKKRINILCQTIEQIMVIIHKKET